MTKANFIFLPDYQVFETASLARNNGETQNSCLKLFKHAWSYYIDEREKLIIISRELNEQLVESHYKSSKKKRQALFSVVTVYSEIFGCNHNLSQLKLASILSIEEDKKIYFVSDNDNLKNIVNKFGLFEAISSEKAVELLSNLS